MLQQNPEKTLTIYIHIYIIKCTKLVEIDGFRAFFIMKYVGGIVMEVSIFALVMCVLSIYLCYWIAKQFQEVAINKGFRHEKYFWLSFLIPPVGYALIIALPDRGGNQANTVQRMSDELPNL